MVRKAIRAFICVAIAAAWATSGCRDEEELPPPPKSMPTQVIDDFTLTETDGENISWRLKADRADIYDYSNEAKIFVVHVDFYEEGEYSSTLTSREGTIDLLRHNMEARGDVVLVSRKDGAVLKTEELDWDSDEGRIYSDAYCTLERGRSVIRGQGFKATPGLESFSTHELDADILDKEMHGLDAGRRIRAGTGEEPGGGPK
jgi:LPS export ABC transporter protein LptC